MSEKDLGLHVGVDVCYLCGKLMFAGEELSRDHRVPQLMLKNGQPKRNGIRYAGRVITHRACNNHFIAEKFFAPAMQILRAVHHPDFDVKGSLAEDPTLPVRFINYGVIGDISQEALERFGLRELFSRLPTAAEVRRGRPVNLEREITTIVLSVLVKSAAALVQQRFGMSTPSQWRIRAIPCLVESGMEAYLAEEFLQGKPFGDGIFASEKEFHHYFEVVYVAEGIVAYLCICKPDAPDQDGDITLPDTDTWKFGREMLTDAVNPACWTKVYNPPPRR